MFGVPKPLDHKPACQHDLGSPKNVGFRVYGLHYSAIIRSAGACKDCIGARSTTRIQGVLFPQANMEPAKLPYVINPKGPRTQILGCWGPSTIISKVFGP